MAGSGLCFSRFHKDSDMKFKKENVPYMKAGAVLLAASAVLQICVRQRDGFADWYAHEVYPVLVGIWGRIWGIFPFSLVEAGLYVLAAVSLFYVVRNFFRPGRIFSRAFFVSGILLFSYTVSCGINYHAAAFSEYAQLNLGKYEKEELVELCQFLTEKVNEIAPERLGTEKDSAYLYSASKEQWQQDSVRAMKTVGELFPVLGGFYPKPKEVAVSWILSVQQLCGIYSPFTIEANYNGDMPDYNIPHTMCHELSHLKGFMREDEANFIGYLACVLSENPAFQYSGYLTGWIYAGNALASVDMETYTALYGQLSESVLLDLAENSQFWNRYEGKVAEAANKMNDTYLKINSQKDGVRSYGRMVDLMLAFRRKQIK